MLNITSGIWSRPLRGSTRRVISRGRPTKPLPWRRSALGSAFTAGGQKKRLSAKLLVFVLRR